MSRAGGGVYPGFWLFAAPDMVFSPFLVILHICTQFLLRSPAFTLWSLLVLLHGGSLWPFGTSCPTEQNSWGQMESTWGSAVVWPIAPLSDTDKNRPCSRECHPQLSAPSPAPTPPGDGVRPSRETPEPCSPPLPFLQRGHRLHAQFSRPASQLRLPARLLRTGILLKNFLSPGVVGFPGAGQHCQESEKGKASARLRHRGCRRTAQFPSKPVPNLWGSASLWTSVHRRDPPLLCLRPLGSHGKLWDARIEGGTFDQESHFPSSAEHGPHGLLPKRARSEIPGNWVWWEVSNL